MVVFYFVCLCYITGGLAKRQAIGYISGSSSVRLSFMTTGANGVLLQIGRNTNNTDDHLILEVR